MRCFILSFILFISLSLVCSKQASCQFKSIDFEISTSPYFDDRTDEEYDYNFKSISGIVQWGIGYSTFVNKKFVVSPKISYGLGYELYRTRQFSPVSNTLPDSTLIEKRKTAKFFKVGIGFSYWFKSPGNGFYAKSEVQNIFALSALSREKKRVGLQDFEEYTIDYKDELKSSVPSLRLGIGYNLMIKRIILFVRVSLEFRASPYFNTIDNYTWANRSLGFGFRYALQKNQELYN